MDTDAVVTRQQENRHIADQIAPIWERRRAEIEIGQHQYDSGWSGRSHRVQGRPCSNWPPEWAIPATKWLELSATMVASSRATSRRPCSVGPAGAAKS